MISIPMYYSDTLFLRLKGFAYIKARSFLCVPRNEAEIIALELASDFFYSNSLHSAFDSSKGKIEAFFKSWVDKSLLHYFTKLQKQRGIFSIQSDQEPVDDHPTWDRFEEILDGLVGQLRGKSFMYRGVKICLDTFVKAMGLQVIKGELRAGRVSLRGVARYLGIGVGAAQKAYRFILEEYKDGKLI